MLKDGRQVEDKVLLEVLLKPPGLTAFFLLREAVKGTYGIVVLCILKYMH